MLTQDERDPRLRGVRRVDRLMDDTVRSGKCGPQLKVPSERCRFAACSCKHVCQRGLHDRRQSVPGSVFASVHGLSPGVYPDLESAYATQGGTLLSRELIEEFDSLQKAECYMELHRRKKLGIVESCSTLAVLDRGRGFAMRTESWGECVTLARNHPDAVFMIFREERQADLFHQERSNSERGLAFDHERRLLAEQSDEEPAVGSAESQVPDRKRARLQESEGPGEGRV